MIIVKRSLVMFITLFFIVKVLGKKQIKNLTLYDYILSITIGSIAGDTIISLDTPLRDGVLALLIFGFIGYVTSYITFHSHTVEEMVDGEPLVLYENNDFNYHNLEISKLSVAKVLEQCRLKNCFDINELECAVLETSGDISSNDVKKDIQKNSKKQTLSNQIIVDGILNEQELKKAHKNKDWLTKYLTDNKKKLEDISLLTIDKNNKITVYQKTNS